MKPGLGRHTTCQANGYRIMWLVVMFDLPVTTKTERKLATQFRNNLLDMGFEMMQFSVYTKFCSSKSKAKTVNKMIEAVVPHGGLVSVLEFTDKQYEGIKNYEGKVLQPGLKPPGQLAMF